MEVDDIPADLSVKANSAQVARYLAAYGLVLVTNFRDFILIGRDPQGRPQPRERFSFDCKDATAFFALARAPKRPPSLAARFAEFLERVLLHQAPLEKPEDVAFFLASYARDARARVEAHATLPAFAQLRESLQEALGLTFDTVKGERVKGESVKGEHLFRSTLVQTLFYGLFSAWVEVAQSGAQNFDWRSAGWNLHVPFVDTLFQRIATPDNLKPLGLEEPLGWAADALNRVDRAAFFKRFEERDAIRYFYEPFLAAYDPELRRDLGVWYTPREIVRYMVERVDQVLRSELNLPDGLADPSVWVLDPCCGTGAYLVEVLDRIARTLREKGEDALTASDLKQAAMTRIAGFEIMPAPYVIAHWQIGHFLRDAGVPLADNERAAIYLTNALTGWAAPTDAHTAQSPQRGISYTYPPLADERDKAADVKRGKPILVVLGNPPYNAFAGTSPAEESGLVVPYKEGLQKDWGIKKFNLDDLYVRFFRIAERRIAEGTGRGVVCFITNHSWVSFQSYVMMRQRLFREFDKIWIDNLHGDRKISERGPDGATSETIFAMRGFSPGIRQGTAISLLVRKSERLEATQVYYGDRADASNASNRRRQLLESLLDSENSKNYRVATPTSENRFLFQAAGVTINYQNWPTVASLSADYPLNGLMEKRAKALIDDDRVVLERRLKTYFDGFRSWSQIREEVGGLGHDAARFPAEKTRDKALLQSSFASGQIVQYFVRPYDICWAYVTPQRPIWNEPRPTLQKLMPVAGGFLISRPSAVASPEGYPIAWTNILGDNDALRGHAYYTPAFIQEDGATVLNLSADALAWLATIGVSDETTDQSLAFLPWHHALAIGYSPAWLSENADGIRQNWPRIPLPNTAALLKTSAALGARVAALLDPETHVPGITAGAILPALATIAVPTKPAGGGMTDTDRELTAGWGHAGKGAAVMPGRGRSQVRPYAATEAAATYADLLGGTTYDIYLNANACWANVPEQVWNFTIGGYQVLKKWLSYREQPLLNRPLSPTEIRYFRDVTRRLAALRLMAPELDANYRACAAAHLPLAQALEPP